MTAALKVADLTKTFGSGIRALDSVSFEVPAHSVFGLLGPNGAGKTTFFSVAANFLRPDRGTIQVLGLDSQRISELKGRLAILPQDAEFERNSPILEQLVFFRMLDGQNRATAETEVARALALVGLSEYGKRSAKALSHGMTKRLGIAQAFLGTPEVIMLDEPTAGLDPANAKQIRDLIQTLRGRATIMVSSHNLAEIQDLCDHVAILDKGRVVTCGPMSELTSGPRELDVRLARPLTADELANLAAVPAVLSIDGAKAPDYAFKLRGDSSLDDSVAALLRALLDLGAVPRRLHEGRSLERHFLEVTKGPQPPAR